MGAEIYICYGIYNPETCECIQEGDRLERLTYWKDESKVTISNVTVTDIYGLSNRVVLERDNLDIITLSIDEIEEWR